MRPEQGDMERSRASTEDICVVILEGSVCDCLTARGGGRRWCTVREAPGFISTLQACFRDRDGKHDIDATEKDKRLDPGLRESQRVLHVFSCSCQKIEERDGINNLGNFMLRPNLFT
jgi:hypothetical protein